jgi:hypothetical protein
MCIILSSSSNQKQNFSFSLFTFLFPHSKVAGKYVFIIERSKNVVIIKLCKYECKRKFLHEIYRQAGKKKKDFMRIRKYRLIKLDLYIYIISIHPWGPWAFNARVRI